MKLNLLVVDDEHELRRNVETILRNHFHTIELKIDQAENGKQALEKVYQNSYDLVLMDVRMPELNGLEALSLIKSHEPRTFVVIMTAHSNLQDAVTAIREGAYDYLEKPINPSRLSEIVDKSLEARKVVDDLALSNPIFDDDVDSEFVGSSSKMKEIFSLIYKLCKVDTTVLIRGENGTGKELVAKAIHMNSSRKDGQFVAVNCGAIPENLMESEFFGHEKGAFTGASERKVGRFQVANNGTLFLDEIGELRPEMQVKLLRVLQDRTYTPVGSNRELKSNARIIAATNRNLEKMIADGQFREDLFYRLNVLPLFIPPLRDRRDDIPLLVQHFIKKYSKIMNTSIHDIETLALQALQNYTWPGNIRELENIIERSFIIENSETIHLKSLPPHIQEASLEKSATIPSNSVRENLHPLDYDIFKEQSEKDFIIAALKANKGRINQTVAQANIPKNTLLRKIKKYGIQVKDFLSDESRS